MYTVHVTAQQNYTMCRFDTMCRTIRHLIPHHPTHRNKLHPQNMVTQGQGDTVELLD